MLNKDKRSLVLSLILGDGCLHYFKRYVKRGNQNQVKLYGGITIDHGIQQSDYQKWKAELLSKIFNRNVKLRTGHKGNSIQLCVCSKRLRAWRKFTYPNNKKDLTKILPFIRHPEFAISVWLMDDGYVEPSISKLASGEKKLYGARFRIFTQSQPLEKQQDLINWFVKNFGVNPKVHLTKDRDKKVPFIKFNQADSLKLWDIIREFVLQFKSMQYKFRYIEQLYQLKCLQRIPSEKLDDIVSTQCKLG